MIGNGLAGKKKGQAAIEYLMTYGWAILVIAIVIVALYMMTQTSRNVQMCNMPAGFVCNDPLPQIYTDASSQDSISLILHNRQGQAINVSGVLCTTKSPAEADAALMDDSIAPMIQPGTSATFTTKCRNSATSYVTLPSGQQFSGYVIIYYNYDNDPNPTVHRTTIATVADTVQKA